jgi:hypothetical protein
MSWVAPPSFIGHRHPWKWVIHDMSKCLSNTIGVATGSQSRETERYGYKSHGTRNQEWLFIHQFIRTNPAQQSLMVEKRMFLKTWTPNWSLWSPEKFLLLLLLWKLQFLHKIVKVFWGRIGLVARQQVSRLVSPLIHLMPSSDRY